jgi:hypothetical protein
MMPDISLGPAAKYCAIAALALAGLLTLSPTSGTVGVSQRLLEFAVLAWAVYCGGYLARHNPGGIES